MLHVIVIVPHFAIKLCVWTHISVYGHLAFKFFYFFFKKDIMNSEKSYDSLPNFTAADCKYLIMLKVVMLVCLCVCMLFCQYHNVCF